MQRLELAEREVVLSQSAEDRRAGVWHVWTNDNFWHRRLTRVGAAVVEEGGGGGKTYTLDQRQVLIRRIPAKREQGPRVIEFLKRKQDKENRKAVQISAGADIGVAE